MEPSDRAPGKVDIPRDTLGRPLANLRLSVTDRCNLRCAYCMPEENYTWLPKSDVLSFEETARLVDVFCGLGVRKVRLTGGEPLLRRGLDQLVGMLAAKDQVEDLAMTTNGILLSDQAPGLKAAGLGRLTLSLDTLDPKRFRELTRRDDFSRCIAGIEAAAEAGFRGTKLNVVAMRGVNDDELEDLVHFGQRYDLEVRFIEYMDVGGATGWDCSKVISRAEILDQLGKAFGGVAPVGTNSNDESALAAPAQRYQLGNGSVVGVIASTTTPFCGTCDRSRLTADGRWFRCLYARAGTDLRGPLRSGMDSIELAELIAGTWRARADRGAQDRLGQELRAPLASAPELRADPHLEMHTRGG
ncbi:MAG: cyclic pyranopterin phosphate synthase [Planctomycetota bacterium]|jgi:cyclic pyranopterin phosphate synthase